MIDCGESASASFMRFRIGWDFPDAIFISHLHFDHSSGLFMLLQSMHLEKRKKPLKIFIPEDGAEIIQNLLKASSFVPEILSFELVFEKLQHSVPVFLNDVQILPVLNSHLDSFREKTGHKYGFKYESFSFYIKRGETKIFHTCDIGGIQDLEFVLKERIKALVCELSHVNPEQLFALLQNYKLEWLILVHLHRRYRRGIEELKMSANKLLPDTKCVIPEDGAEIFLETA